MRYSLSVLINIFWANCHQCIQLINTFQSSVAFHIESSHLFYKAKQITGFYMERNTRLKRLNIINPLSANPTE